MSLWFAPLQDFVDKTRPPGQQISFDKYDFARLLRPDAPWQLAARRISVFTVAGHTMEHFTNLASVVDFIRKRQLKVVTSGSFVFTNGQCLPNGMEGIDIGHGFARETVGMLRQWRDAGGRLDYIVMDGPLYFGYTASAKACHFSMAEVARRVSATVSEVRKLYPDVRIVDAEGPGAAPVAEWLPLLARWLDNFKHAVGRPIDALSMDLHWRDAWHTGYNWIDAARRITGFLQARGVQSGLYIDAEDDDVDAAGWMRACEAHISAAANSNIPLDFIYIASWMKYPDRNLPENDPASLTYLINDAYDAFQH